MVDVLIGLIPAIIVATFFFSWGVLTNIVLGIISALVFEAICLKLRDRPVLTFLSDGSAMVTGALLGIAIPQLAPWWLVVVGIFCAIVVAKQMYGGIGYNPFNPAAVGYVVLLISFPKEMSQWITPYSSDALSFADTMRVVFTGYEPAPAVMDLITHASPIDYVKTQLKMGLMMDEIYREPVMWGAFAGKGWEFVNLALMAGGLWLIWRKVITWHIPVAMLGAVGLMALIVWGISPDAAMNPITHLFSGGIMLGAFFIATDPVSAATSNKGRLIYAAGIGLITYIIRTWGGYPDGIAFAVLLMNMSAAMIDNYTVPRVYGFQKSGDK